MFSDRELSFFAPPYFELLPQLWSSRSIEIAERLLGRFG